MLNEMNRAVACGVVLSAAVMLGLGGAGVARGAAAPGVSETDKMVFTQKDVQAQMQELQDRMFHLADLTKESEPDNATRLLLAVRQARESLIMEQMNEVLAKLSSQDMSHAATETQEVLVKLNDLKSLLVATDLELQLQLERLRKLQAAIKAVDEAIKVEKAQQSRSAALAKSGKAPEPGALKEAKTDQAANRNRTEAVAASVKSLGNLDAAERPLNASSGSMAQAEASLGGGKPGEADPLQGAATKKLEEARAALAQEREKVLAELGKQVKKVVIANLQEMLDRQVAVRQATETLAPRLKGEREAVMKLQQLAPAEQRIATICHQTLDLVNETEFSLALPPALESLEQNMLYISGDLTGGRGGTAVIASEVGVEQDLRELLDTFKTMTGDGMCNSQCKGCKGDMNKLLAELKVVRIMQMRVNRGTAETDGEARRAAAAELPKELQERIVKLRDGQESTRSTMERLHERFAE